MHSLESSSPVHPARDPRRLAAATLSLLALLFIDPSGAQAAETSQLSAGTAKVELTPLKRVPLAGYSKRKGKRSTGVHDPVFARALVLKDERTALAIVSADLLIINEPLFQAVEQRLEADPPVIGPVTLLLAATHTHSGPGGYGRTMLEKIGMGHYDQAVFDHLADRIADSVRQAATTLRPAEVTIGSAAVHGVVKNRVEPDGIVDDRLTVLTIRSGAEPMAFIANFAAHPTTLGAWQETMSADYPGVFSTALETQHPGSVALFLVGAVGDQAPVKQGEGFERASWLGRKLVQAAAQAMQSTAPSSTALAAKTHVLPLPPARIRLSRRVTLPHTIGRGLADDDASLVVMRVGDAALIGAPCDLLSELGQALKRHAAERGLQPIIVGFANDYIGYCLPERLYGTEHYEAKLALNGPRAGELLVEALKHLIDDVATASQP